jgi:hypothetical protein
MEPKLFYIGQQITPRKRPLGLWNNSIEHELLDDPYPSFGEIVTVLDYNPCQLVQFYQGNFAPVISDSVLEKELSQIEILEEEYITKQKWLRKTSALRIMMEMQPVTCSS